MGRSTRSIAAYERVPSPMSSMLWFPIHGAATRVAPDATAFPHRRGIHLGVYSLWTDPGHNAANIAWARDTWQALRPFASHAVYVNDLGEDESAIACARRTQATTIGSQRSRRSTIRRTCSG